MSTQDIRPWEETTWLMVPPLTKLCFWVQLVSNCLACQSKSSPETPMLEKQPGMPFPQIMPDYLGL